MILVSVIIPIFNAEKFLDECIHSLLNQTISACEFIFVNDGSIDGSQAIIEEFQKKDSRIILINQVNQGVSVARNNGIAIAKGEFISFVDGDDYIKNDMLQTLAALAQESGSDIVISGHNKEYDGAIITFKTPFPVCKPFTHELIQKDILPFMIKSDGLNSVWTKIYRREFLISNHINFPQGVALGEDGLFNFKAFHFASKAIFTDYCGYFYREVTGSATRNLTKNDYFERDLEVFHFDYAKFVPLNWSPQQIEELKGFRLVNKVLSNCAVYSRPNSQISGTARYRYVKAMITNPILAGILKSQWANLASGKSKFQKFVLFCIKQKMTLPIWLAMKYSNLRNKTN
jgi:glycosyltransferase involved in cell wall biosynthesis